MSVRWKKALRAAATVSLGSAGTLSLTATAGAAPGVTAARLAGPNRVATAAAVAQASFPGGSANAVLASGDNFPDALSGAYLAGKLHAPILLTAAGTLSPETAAALSALDVTGVVYLLGGPAAVSSAVETTLQGDGYRVSRLYGANRDVTAADVAEVFPSSNVGSLGSAGPTAIVATGMNFPDALAGSPVAYAESFPILLTVPNALDTATAGALSTLGIKNVLLLGGTAALSAGVASSIQSMGITVTRVAGSDRTGTATGLADLEVSQLGFSAAHANLARGDFYADALAGGAHAGQEKAPVLLTASPGTLGPLATSWLQAHASTLTSIHVFGGTTAVTDSTVSAAQHAAG